MSNPEPISEKLHRRGVLWGVGTTLAVTAVLLLLWLLGMSAMMLGL